MRGFLTISAGSALLILVSLGCGKDKVDFSAEVKPILNKHCISCHGGVKQNANFSLLFRHEAMDTAESGKRVIIPGDAPHSELIRRITSNDPDLRMPYKEAPLTKKEIDILTQWINEGAEWGDHWAYVAPKPVAVPGETSATAGFSSKEAEWTKNPIDNFILAKLKENDLNPSVQADKASLIRRVYLDIIGLPPTVQQADAFINDKSPDAWEKTVDGLLASKHFGEKWATWWLDMARYADTKGYEKDGGRSMWRYRDWVIKAFNSDMPFDQFTTEQLAGDLLPDPTDDQLIATAFHRNTMNNDEGGTDDEEFRIAALIDRVNTTWEVWQSTTMGCVQCHTHPYDPFVNKEYYNSLAFFNNTSDEDIPGDHPNLRMYNEADQKKLDAILSWIKEKEGKDREKEINKFLRTLEPKFYPREFDQFVNGTLLDNKWLGIRHGGSARLKQRKLDGKAFFVMNYWHWSGNKDGRMLIRKDRPDGEVLATFRIDVNGVVMIPLPKTDGVHDLYFSFYNPTIKNNWEVCAVEWMAFIDDFPDKGTPQYTLMKESFVQLINAQVENTPIMVEKMPDQQRTTNMFIRGSFLTKGDVVTPGIPESLNPFPANAPNNRLGLSQWLTSKDNPLTSRAMVNRFWEQIFGTGLVETLEDFGTQGMTPTHPELLDWLALRFMNDHHWSMKKLVKDLVMSSTYQQDAHLNKELLEKDPANRFLARGPRIRLSFEQIRDQALIVSGLLSDKMYGKSVMPYQPAGIWASVYSGEKWTQSKGEDQFRRSVYTYIKRTSPYPSMMMFDGSSREVCVSRRIRTNTPLQALVTLNDSSFVVASRHFARMMTSKKGDVGEQIGEGYRMLLFHSIADKKLEILTDLYNESVSEFKKDRSSTERLTGEKNASPELAAMTVVANAMLNLDEVITKE